MHLNYINEYSDIVKYSIDLIHPNHISKLGVFNPKHLTENVIGLLKQINEDGMSPFVSPNKAILADALEEAGVTDKPLLKELREISHSYPHQGWNTRSKQLAALNSVILNTPEQINKKWKGSLPSQAAILKAEETAKPGEIGRHNAEDVDMFYHRTAKNRDGSALRVRRNGKTKLWARNPDEYSIPFKYGLYDYGYITPANAHEWTTGE